MGSRGGRGRGSGGGEQGSQREGQGEEEGQWAGAGGVGECVPGAFPILLAFGLGATIEKERAAPRGGKGRAFPLKCAIPPSI